MENSTSPILEQDRYFRCTRCSDGGVGTVLSIVDINIRFAASPDLPVAKMIRCCRCGWVLKKWIIPAYTVEGDENQEAVRMDSVAEVYKITSAMLRSCLSRFPKRESFTLEELRDVQHIKYNPNAYIEPVQEEVF